MKKHFYLSLAVVSILLVMVRTTASSCPVCFGALDDPATNGMNYAIFTLLGVTGSVLAGFISFALRLRRLSQSVVVSKEEA